MRAPLLVLPVLAALGQAPADAAVLTMRADHWCPYNCAPDSDRPGYIIEILQAVFGPAGHSIDYQLMPWSQTLEEVRRGTYTAAVGALNDEAPDFVFPEEPLGIIDDAFAVRQGFPFHYDSVLSLMGLRVAGVKDYSYGNPALDLYLEVGSHHGESVQLLSGENVTAQNLEKLAAWQVDVVLENLEVLHYTLAAMGMADKVDIVPMGNPMPLHVAFSPADPKAPEYARQLSDGIAALRASGRLAAILARYGLTDWR